MAEIIKVYQEALPPVRFIGKRYTNADRINGGYGHLWGEWFANGWFAALENLGTVDGIENGQLGFMRCAPDFEYWIGMFLSPNTPVPDGYAFFDLPLRNVGICWINGQQDDGSIFAMHDRCVAAVAENGMTPALGSDTFFFERYICPRFTTEDEQGNVILDYGVYLAK